MAAASSKSTSGVCEHEVFLSFRGTDTRYSFTDCLYQALLDDSVVVFRDSEGLHFGDKLEELLRALSNSKICVVVLSKGYASSAWCLREIEHAMNLHESTGTPKILPIFLDVTPVDVKLKTALYADALNEHKEKHGDDQVGRWKAALKMVAQIKGWEAQGQGHSKLINSVAREISTIVKKREQLVTDLVGIDERVNGVMQLLDIDSQNVRLIGIHGIGGIGKTTLTKIIFNKLYSHFEKCSFMSDVRESMNKNGIVDLQKKLFRDLHNSSHVDNITDVDEGRRFLQMVACSKKVLIVLDDIDKIEQLHNLMGATSFLGLGSRVLITTRDKGILSAVHGIITYEVHQLDHDQALKLFSMHAFKADSPPYPYHSLSNQVVSKIGGLPLALGIVGSHLQNESKEVWGETLDELSKTFPNKVLDKLIISYCALSKNQKCIFLDIACFMIKWKITKAMDVWEACNLSPRSALVVLTNKSLIKISDDGYIWMHDQLRDLGREIVCQEYNMDVAKRSRLWNPKEAIKVVRLKKIKDKVETLVLAECSITNEELESLPNLRFLQLIAGTFVGDFKNHISKLRSIHWYNPHPNYRLTNFHLKELTHFELSCHAITEEWAGWNLLKVTNNIKVLVLEKCTRLIRSPDLSGCVCLEKLSFHGSNFQVIDSSIGKLITLEHLDISQTKITELPDSIRYLKRLKVLIMDNCSIQNLSSIIAELRTLEELHAKNCGGLAGELLNEIIRLSFFRILSLSDTYICAVPLTIYLQPLSSNCSCVCSSSMQPVFNLSYMRNLVTLLLWSESQEALMPTFDTAQTSLVRWIQRSLESKELEIIGMLSTMLGDLAHDIFDSEIISSWFTNLKCDLSRNLSHLSIHNCSELHAIEVIGNLESLRKIHITECNSLERIDGLSNCKDLSSISINNCHRLKVVEGIDELEALCDLSVWECQSLEQLIDVHNTKLKDICIISIWKCKNLHETGASDWPDTIPLARYKKTLIPLKECIERSSRLENLKLHFPIFSAPLTKLDELTRDSFNSKIIHPCFFNMRGLIELELFCVKVDEIQLSGLEILRHLSIVDCELLKEISIASSLRMLKELLVSRCPLLVEIQISTELESLEIRYCDSLKRLLDLSKLRKLRNLSIHSCYDLQEIKILGDLKYLRKFQIVECNSLWKIGVLSNCENLISVSIHNCNEIHGIEFFGNLKSLRHFHIEKCNLLRKIGGLSNCKNLEQLFIHLCHGLQVVEGINELEDLCFLTVWECGSLEELIDAQSTKLKDKCNISIWKCEKLLETCAAQRPISLTHYKGILAAAPPIAGTDMAQGSNLVEQALISTATESSLRHHTPAPSETPYGMPDLLNLLEEGGHGLMRDGALPLVINHVEHMIQASPHPSILLWLSKVKSFTEELKGMLEANSEKRESLAVALAKENEFFEDQVQIAHSIVNRQTQNEKELADIREQIRILQEAEQEHLKLQAKLVQAAEDAESHKAKAAFIVSTLTEELREAGPDSDLVDFLVKTLDNSVGHLFKAWKRVTSAAKAPPIEGQEGVKN